MTTSHRLGELGEDLARIFLQMCGYRFLQGRFRVPAGEIDLIMESGQVLVFVEVKTRSRGGPALPEEYVTPGQLERLHKTAHTWLARRGPTSRVYRFEVVAVEFGGEDKGLEIRHYRTLG